MQHWATLLDIIQHGIEGDTEKCRAYSELLLSKLDESEPMVKHLTAILEGKPKGNIIHVAEQKSNQ